MAKKKESLSTTQKVGIGVGITATAVAAAGAYFLGFSPNAKQNRAKLKSWMLKAKADVLEQLEKAQEMTREEYEELIDVVASGYATLKDASKKEIEDFRKEMKQHWGKIEKQGKSKVKKTAGKAKSAAAKTKPAAKKTASKAKKTATKS